MNVNVKNSGPWQHTVEVEVSAYEVEARLADVTRHLQRHASLPGFRRGRVPLDLVRQNYAEHVEAEFLDRYVPKFAGEALEQAGLDPVVPPLVRNLNFIPGSPLRFEAVVDVRPEVEVQRHTGLPATRRVRPVTDGDVDRVLDRLREDSAVFVDLDRPAGRGDVVLLDSVRLDVNGRRLSGTRAKAQRVQLGAPDVPPDLENGLLGAEAGQERTVEVRYPDDDERRELAGRTVRYLVSVRKIQEKKLRPADDNLARELFQLESLEELRSRIRRNLEAEEKLRSGREVEAAVSEELIRHNPVELPERLVGWTLERVIEEATGGRELSDSLRRELEDRFRPNVVRSLQREVLLRAVARKEKLEVGEEDVAAEIQRMAQADPRQAARVRARYQSAERRRALQESLLERRALEFVVQAAVVREETVAGTSPLVVPAGR
jgi:trigger factor